MDLNVLYTMCTAPVRYYKYYQMKSQNIILNLTLSLVFAIFCMPTILAQEKTQVQLLDATDLSPIEGATFQYEKQTGISDKDGIITFTLLENEVMTLSHINYGSWQWDENELKSIIDQKVYYREPSIVNLYPVTVIAVNPVKHIDDAIEIKYQERMEHDAAAILNQVPALNSIRKSGNYGFDPVFRGFKYDQLNIVLNGAQSATAACPNRMDPPTSQMAPNMLERIEILKGPYALRYGSSVGGTINFVTNKDQFTQEQEVHGRLSSAYQSNGDVLSSEGHVGLSTHKTAINIFGAWAQGNDYKAGNDQTIPANFERGSFGTSLGFKVAANQQLSLSATYNFARDVDFAALPMDLRSDDTWMFNARHDMTFNKEKLKSWNTTLYGSFVDHVMDNLSKNLNPRMMNASTDAKTYNYGGRTEGYWILGNDKLYSGADMRIEGAQGERTREFLMGPMAGNTAFDNVWQKAQISKAAIFGEYHLNSKAFHYVLSARLELNHAKAKDPSNEFEQVYSETDNTQFNPSISVGVVKKLNPIELGLWLGRVQRSGGLTERFINFFPVGQDPYELVGNPELKPEVNNQMDVTFQWGTKKSVINLDVFISYMQNYISSFIDPALTPRLPSSPGVRRYANIDDAFKTGFEINWTQELGFGLHHQLGIAYTYAEDLERNEPLPEIAPLDFRYALKGSYFNGKLHPEASFRQVLRQHRISEEFGETETPAFSLVDVKVQYKASKSLRLEAGVTNVFDQAYYEHLNRSVTGTNTPIYDPGRNFFVSANFTF